MGGSIVHNIRFAVVLSALLFAASPCLGRDNVVMVPIAGAINLPDAQQKLGISVKFYFGAQATARIAQTFGAFVANPKTNAFARTTDKACERAFLSALISLQDRAIAMGANAVVKIESFYKKHEVSSETEFECHKGFLIAGVALRGDVVRLVDQ